MPASPHAAEIDRLRRLVRRHPVVLTSALPPGTPHAVPSWSMPAGGIPAADALFTRWLDRLRARLGRPDPRRPGPWLTACAEACASLIAHPHQFSSPRSLLNSSQPCFLTNQLGRLLLGWTNCEGLALLLWQLVGPAFPGVRQWNALDESGRSTHALLSFTLGPERVYLDAYTQARCFHLAERPEHEALAPRGAPPDDRIPHLRDLLTRRAPPARGVAAFPEAEYRAGQPGRMQTPDLLLTGAPELPADEGPPPEPLAPALERWLSARLEQLFDTAEAPAALLSAYAGDVDFLGDLAEVHAQRLGLTPERANPWFGEGRARWALHESLYPRAALLGACQLFLDRAFLFLQRRARGEIIVHLRSRGEPIEHLLGELANELLNQTQRHRIGAREARTRDLYLTAAFGQQRRTGQVHRAAVARPRSQPTAALDGDELAHFRAHGWVRLAGAFSPEMAARWVREAIQRVALHPQQVCKPQELRYADLSELDPDDPKTWRFIMLSVAGDRTVPIRSFAPRVHAALEQLLGTGRLATDFWSNYLIFNMGAPQPDSANPAARAALMRRLQQLPSGGQDVWHVDDPARPTRLDRWHNGMLTIAFFTKVKAGGGGTCLLADSPRVIARAIARRGELDLDDPALREELSAASGPVIELTGSPGDVILCHPMMLHAPSNNVWREPRVAANPNIRVDPPLSFRPAGPSLVEQLTASWIDDL